MSPPFGAKHRLISVRPVVETSLYTTGDLVGEKLSFAGAAIPGAAAAKGVIKSVVITDDAAQAANMDVVFFDADPSATTFTDNAAFTPADADLAKIVGVAQLTTHVSFADNSVSLSGELYIPFDLGTATTLYAALVVRAGPTYVATDDLQVRIGILQD